VAPAVNPLHREKAMDNKALSTAKVFGIWLAGFIPGFLPPGYVPGRDYPLKGI